MARNISFALTTPQFLARTKTVTRRMGWRRLKAGDILCGVKKGMGLKLGEKVERLGMIRVINARREPLNQICADLAYGCEETIREGFPPPHELSEPTNFLLFFCDSHKGCKPQSIITRIEFEFVSPASTPDLHGEGG